MKFVAEAKKLAEVAATAAKIVEKRNTIPILSNALIRADGGSIEYVTTDLDILLSQRFQATVDSPGATTLPGHLLNDIVRKLPAGAQVQLEMKDNTVRVTSGRSRFELQCLPAEDFPDFTTGAFSHRFDLTADQVEAMIGRIQFAVSTEETRYYLNGVFLHGRDDKLVAVATDGHRLARAVMAPPDGAQNVPGIIIPRKTVGEILSLVKAKQTFTFEVSETKLRITVGDVVLTSKLIDGTFPDYERVIPAPNNTVALVEAKDLAAAADRVATMTSERGRAVKLTFDNGKIDLLVNNPDSGSATDSIDVDYPADAKLEIGFNSAYLADALKTRSGKVRISAADGGSPSRIEGVDDDGLLVVLMPMRV